MLPSFMPPSTISLTTGSLEIAASTGLPKALCELITSYDNDFLLEAMKPLTFNRNGTVRDITVRSAMVAIFSLSDPGYWEIRSKIFDNLKHAPESDKADYAKALQGIFDQVRRECCGVIHMEGIVLKNIELRKFNLSGMIARGAHFEEVIFTFSKLTNADLSDSTLSNCEFNGVTMQNASLTDASMEAVAFNEVNMEGVQAIDVDFESCFMHEVEVPDMVVNDPLFVKQSIQVSVWVNDKETMTPVVGSGGSGELSDDEQGEVFTSSAHSPRDDAAVVTLPARQLVPKNPPAPKNKHIGIKRQREDK